MNKILMLERELKLNRMNVIKYQHSTDATAQKEYRALLIQRSNLKDMLIQEYRNEVLEKRKDIEFITGEET